MTGWRVWPALVLVLAGEMAMAEEAAQVSCIAEGKARVPQGLCDAFAAGMAEVRPGEGPVRLVVLAAGEARLAARIDWHAGEGWTEGRAFAMARAGAALDDAAIAAFLTDLIAASPRP